MGCGFNKKYYFIPDKERSPSMFPYQTEALGSAIIQIASSVG